MAHDPNKVAALVAAINSAHGQDLELADKMPRGVNGAWTVVHRSSGLKEVLKLVHETDRTQQLLAAKECSRIVNSSMVSTPAFGLIGYFSDIGTFYLQQFLPGLPSPLPTHKLVVQLLELNNRQESSCHQRGRNHYDLLQRTLWEDAQGWQKRIKGFGPEGFDFLLRVWPLFMDRQIAGRTTDVVHGDFQHYNAMVTEEDVLTGYVDWDFAGYGDRSIDLTRLLYDCYVAEAELGYPPKPETIALLKQRIIDISGRAALEVYMAYWCLQVADFGVKIGRADALKFFKVGHKIVTEL